MRFGPGELSATLHVHPRVAWQLLDGEAVLVDLDRGRALGLNASASFLWSRLEGRTAVELADELAAAFALEEAQARHDVEHFLAVLRERGFLAG